MFDGDTSNAGRRERLMRKRESRDAFTDKIGGDPKSGAQIAQTPSLIPNGLFAGGVAGQGTPAGGRGSENLQSRDVRSQQTGGGGDTGRHLDDSSVNFSQRINVKRHSYEVDIICKLPIVDMTSNPKRRSITWIAITPEGEEDAYSIQVPVAYDLEGTTLVVDDFRNGKCQIAVPAVAQSVFG